METDAYPSWLSRCAAFFGPAERARHGYLWARWIFLRCLGLVFLSAFYSLLFQIDGLIGPRGVLPAGEYLPFAREKVGLAKALWYAPTFLWISAGDGALTILVVAGFAGSIALVLNLWPRASLAVCLLAFLSFIGAAQDFASYQSDGMLLEAGFLSLFFAPPGLRPRLGAAHPPSPASLWLLRWEWFRIYFESGLVKLLSGEPQWRDLTAMDHYYENGPLPTWIGWYAEQLPHRFHAGTALFTLVAELGLAWLVFLPRRFRLAGFLVLTPFQVAIIATANYAFLNYLVLILGFLLVDDAAFARAGLRTPPEIAVVRPRAWRLAAAAFALVWVFYATVVAMPGLGQAFSGPLLGPAIALEPFRIANRYGLFAVMTRSRYEVEFQGTRDGTTWVPYPFRYKPQDVQKAPGVYAPYQPRFEWNLWFASLDAWQANPWVVGTEVRLLERSPAVLALFARDPFHGAPPVSVRAVRWRYWFTDRRTRAATGAWWQRELLGPYAPAVRREADGSVVLVGVDDPG